MLTSITPLGERGRGQRWLVTMVWMFAGHVVGGCALGASLALGGLGVGAIIDPADAAAAGLVASLAVAAAAFDLWARPLPGRRQVDERWLTRYRGWVYGLGFGAQLGFGLVTVVNTALVAPMVAAGLLVEPGAAMAIGALYGTIRGVGALGGARVRSRESLRRLHRGIDRSERPVRIVAAVVASALSIGLALAA